MARRPATTAPARRGRRPTGPLPNCRGPAPQSEIRRRQPGIDFNHHVVAAAGIVPQYQVDSQPTAGPLQSRRNLPGQMPGPLVERRSKRNLPTAIGERWNPAARRAAARRSRLAQQLPARGQRRDASRSAEQGHAYRQTGTKLLQTPGTSRRRQHRQIVGAREPTNVKRTDSVDRFEHRRIGEIAWQRVARRQDLAMRHADPSFGEMLCRALFIGSQFERAIGTLPAPRRPLRRPSRAGRPESQRTRAR